MALRKFKNLKTSDEARMKKLPNATALHEALDHI